jgi:hypothetical protein
VGKHRERERERQRERERERDKRELNNCSIFRYFEHSCEYVCIDSMVYSLIFNSEWSRERTVTNGKKEEENRYLVLSLSPLSLSLSLSLSFFSITSVCIYPLRHFL